MKSRRGSSGSAKMAQFFAATNKKTLFSCCDRSNPNAGIARKAMGHSPAGLFGFSHMLGGFPGGQADYLRVPFADVGPIRIESVLPDEKVLRIEQYSPTETIKPAPSMFGAGFA
jgi:threonine dehydrogenase-like Zn-dependent dehydrogenase